MMHDPHQRQSLPAGNPRGDRHAPAAARGFTPLLPGNSPGKPCHSWRGVTGFTITETMVTVAVLVILIGLATPSFREIIVAQGVKTASFDVFAGLILARSEAVTRNLDLWKIQLQQSGSALHQ